MSQYNGHVCATANIQPPPYVDPNNALQHVLEDDEILAAGDPDPQLIEEEVFSVDFVDAAAAAAAAPAPKTSTDDSINTDKQSNNHGTSNPSTSKNQGKGLKRSRPETQKPSKPRKRQKDTDVRDTHGQPPLKKFTSLDDCYAELMRLAGEVIHNHKQIIACKERNEQIKKCDVPNVYSEIKARKKYMMLRKSAYYQMRGRMHSRGRRKQKKPSLGYLYWKRSRV
nr:uncharacterized protein LOC132771228 [Anolis sagrei ordinatus]